MYVYLFALREDMHELFITREQRSLIPKLTVSVALTVALSDEIINPLTNILKLLFICLKVSLDVH